MLNNMMNKLAATVFLVGWLVATNVMAEEEVEYHDFDKMTPSATMEFEITSVKLIAGATWGSGTLNYQGQSYPFKVKAGSLGGLGYKKVTGKGKVYDLNKLEDFPGFYGTATAGANIGNKSGGIGTPTMENNNKVIVRITAQDTSGAQLSLAAGGITIKFEE